MVLTGLEDLLQEISDNEHEDDYEVIDNDNENASGETKSNDDDDFHEVQEVPNIDTSEVERN